MCETAAAERVQYRRLPLAGVEAMTATTSRSFPRHTHDEYGIGLIDQGGHASWSGRGKVEAGPGSFISVNPGEVHDGHAIGLRPRSWRILYFEPAALNGLQAEVTGRDADFEFSRPVFDDAQLRAAFELAFAHARHPDPDAMGCESTALDLIAGMRAHASAIVRSDLGATADVRRARDRLDADPASPVTLAELARECSVSRFQLLRAFRRAYGLPPHAYLMQRRLAQARRLLRAHMPPAEVAIAAGFSDQSHLTRCFARQFGVTPGRYAAS